MHETYYGSFFAELGLQESMCNTHLSGLGGVMSNRYKLDFRSEFMNSEDMALLSFYEEKATVSDKSNVFLVQHRETHRFYIKKILSIYDKDLYLSLKDMNIYGIPRVYHIVEDNDKLIIIEEYINGTPLSSLLNEHGPFTVKEAVEILSSLCDILNRLHSCTPPYNTQRYQAVKYHDFIRHEGYSH